MKKIIFLAIFLPALIFTGCDEINVTFTYEGARTVSVLDGDSEPIEGVTVTLTPGSGDPITKTTNNQGVASFTSLSTGDYALSASLPDDWTGNNYRFTSADVTVEDYTSLVGIIFGYASSPHIVVEDQAGTPIEGASVVLTPYDKTGETLSDTSLDAVTTDADGVADFADIATGKYQMEVSAPADTEYTFSTVDVSVGKDTNLIATAVGITPTVYEISGTVYDMRKDNTTLTGVTLTLDNDSLTEPITVESDATEGTFTFESVDPGTYQLTAEKDPAGGKAYGFVPAEIEVAGDISGVKIVGFEWDQTLDNYSFAIITLWDDNFDDVDTYLTYPSTDPIQTTAPTYTVDDLYTVPEIADPGVTAQFSPETAISEGAERSVLYYDKPSTAADSSWDFGNLVWGTEDFDADLDGTNDTFMMQLDVDDTDGGGPETMMIRYVPFSTTARNSSTDGSDIPYLEDLSSGDLHYTWNGVMEYYVNAFDADTDAADATDDYLSRGFSDSTEAYSADVVTYVFQLYYDEDPDGDEATDDAESDSILLGVYTIPTYTRVEQASVLRINCFNVNNGTNEWYQQFVIAPDIRIATDNTRKSLDTSTSDVPVNEVISLRGRRR